VIEKLIDRARIALVCGLDIVDIVAIFIEDGHTAEVAHNAVRAAEVDIRMTK
jgi:hypothetical protein